MRCLNCGSLHPLPETDPPLCEPCYGLFEATEVRVQKLRTTVPMVWWRDPLRVLSAAHADFVRFKHRKGELNG